MNKAYYEMFGTLDRQGLADEVAEVYRTGATYNDGRQQPGGAQRQHDLLEALERLAVRLKEVTEAQ